MHTITAFCIPWQKTLLIIYTGHPLGLAMRCFNCHINLHRLQGNVNANRRWNIIKQCWSKCGPLSFHEHRLDACLSHFSTCFVWGFLIHSISISYAESLAGIKPRKKIKRPLKASFSFSEFPRSYYSCFLLSTTNNISPQNWEITEKTLCIFLSTHIQVLIHF